MVRVLDPLAALVSVSRDVAAIGTLGPGEVVLVVEVVPAGYVADSGRPDVRVGVADKLVDGEVPVELVDVGDVVAVALVQAVVEVDVVVLALVKRAGDPSHLGGPVVEGQLAVGIAHPTAVLVCLEGERGFGPIGRAVALAAQVLEVQVDDVGPVGIGSVDVQLVDDVDLAGGRV